MKRILLLFGFYFVFYHTYAQEVFPIYSDYLSDNVFLIHPSAAGIGNCGKLRLTYRQQWVGAEEAPSLQTLSFHTKITEKAAIGGIVFNDENGFHAQRGIIGSFAYHLNFGRDIGSEQLSFGISFMYLQNTFDQRNFTSSIYDPAITQGIESSGYYNADFSIAYHYFDAFSYFTVKNLLLSPRNFYNNTYESLNLRRYLLTLGYFFENSRRENSFQFEPSIMGQYIENTGEIFADFNIKVYKDFKDNKQIWAVLSYRQSFENNEIESFKQITPILGINFNKFMVSYTYSHQVGDIVYDASGSHQFTIGYNLFCEKRRSTGCPNVNSRY